MKRRHVGTKPAGLALRETRASFQECLIAALLGLTLACAGGPDVPLVGPSSTPELCLAIEASPNLNLFDGEPHVVALYVYSARSETVFRDADIHELLGGAKPPGLQGPVLELVILPGDKHEVREILPRDTAVVGIVADFYEGPGVAVVEPGCGLTGGSAVVLSASDIQVQ